ncbi:CGI-121-domain-containing protein [Aspergillus ellipticus CBS 707.79]|uniref:EKC/KEOPS complex subunit CGI121 n=1 Tax=Aspergillus ellipticus CBS 707.79 TaxID=1448320 RepID=A0A319D7M5_9EURO|nr:CGI-121-domain-containing protein [Aspergillus ellipticus CBS 707.79]
MSSSLLDTIHLAHLPPSMAVHVAVYRDVQNAPFLRQQLLSANSEFEYAFIDASVVLSRTHALSAVFRAANDFMNGRLKSRNVHSEIVFSLNPTTNIAESFRKFGITDSTKDLLVIKVSVTPEITHDSVAAHLNQYVEGTPVPFDDETLSKIADVAKIKKAYKLGTLNTAPPNQANGTHDDGMKRLELSVLGAIALRGAT